MTRRILIIGVFIGAFNFAAQWAINAIYLSKSQGGKYIVSWPSQGWFQFVSPLEVFRIHYAIGFGSPTASWLYWFANALLWATAAVLILLVVRRIKR